MVGDNKTVSPKLPKLYDVKLGLVGIVLYIAIVIAAWIVLDEEALFFTVAHPFMGLLFTIVLAALYLNITATWFRSVVLPFFIGHLFFVLSILFAALAAWVLDIGTGFGPAAILGIIPFIIGVFISLHVSVGIVIAMILRARSTNRRRFAK